MLSCRFATQTTTCQISPFGINRTLTGRRSFPSHPGTPPELILERNQASRTALSADTACFGAVAMLSDKISDAAISKCRGMIEPSFRVEDTFSIFLLRLRDRQYSMVLFKVVFENLAQLYLQVSLYKASCSMISVLLHASNCLSVSVLLCFQLSGGYAMWR